AIYARSDQIVAGLERAVDPNDDGDAHDAARVALVSLAEPFAAFADGPEARAAAGALALDTLVVSPAGNDGRTAAGYGDVAGPGRRACLCGRRLGGPAVRRPRDARRRRSRPRRGDFGPCGVDPDRGRARRARPPRPRAAGRRRPARRRANAERRAGTRRELLVPRPCIRRSCEAGPRRTGRGARDVRAGSERRLL